MEFVAAKCPNCAGELRLPDDMKKAKCMYCGFDVIVQDAINAVGVNVENLLKLASAAQDAGNNDEAYKYFTTVLEYEPNNYISLLGKAVSAGRLSTYENPRLEELTKGLESAIDYAPENKKEDTRKQATEAILNYKIATGGEINRLVEWLEFAHTYDPKNTEIISAIISKAHGKILSSRDSIEMYEGRIEFKKERLTQLQGYSSKHHDWNLDIKEEKRMLEDYTTYLNGYIEELNYYTRLKNKYLENLQSLNPEVASSLVAKLQKSEEETDDSIKYSQEIRNSRKKISAMQNTGGGCLVMVITVFTMIAIFLFIF